MVTNTSSSFTEQTVHQLWVEARTFELDITRPSATTIQLTITRPLANTPGLDYSILDGAVLTLGTKALTANAYPVDGTVYTADTTWNSLTASKLDTVQVVGFWSNIMAQPWPAGTTSTDGSTSTFSVTITGTDPNTLYFASIHGATNVLQYYPLGIQSYPLEPFPAAKKDGSSYTGSIPTLPSAPLSPTIGMVYFDQQLNLVQYWDAPNLIWIPTRTDAIMSGDINPGVAGQTYMLGGNVLKVFNGTAWVQATSANFQVRVAAGWAPVGKTYTGIMPDPNPNVGDLLYNFTTERCQYWDGANWVFPTPSNTLLAVGSTFIPAFTTPFIYTGDEIPTPYPGLLFYNTAQHGLMVFTGASWILVNTAQQGQSMTDKIGVGSDGSYEARLNLINILKGQLGYPAMCVELTEDQFNIAIDNAIDNYRQLSIGAYEQRFFIFPLMANQMVYYLNSPVDQTDRVVQVMKVHRLNLYGVTGSGPDNTWGQAWAQQWYNMGGGTGDLLSVHLVHAWSEEYQKIFAGDIPFNWNEARRELTLLRAIRSPEKVVLEVEMERSEQELLGDRWCKQFLQNWALAECNYYLGLIRSKYTSGTPGAAGTITLNGDTLLAEARQDMTELKEALLNYEYQNAEHGNVSFLMA